MSFTYEYVLNFLGRNTDTFERMNKKMGLDMTISIFFNTFLILFNKEILCYSSNIQMHILEEDRNNIYFFKNFFNTCFLTIIFRNFPNHDSIF